MIEKPTREQLEVLAKLLADDGRLIESGWIGLRIAAVPPNASQVQIDAMRSAFMAGAMHVFSSLMNMLDPDEEPTAKEMHRMTLMAKELNTFAEEMNARLKTEGSA